jgi:hypothetical protein
LLHTIRLHGVSSKKTVIIILAAVITLDFVGGNIKVGKLAGLIHRSARIS